MNGQRWIKESFAVIGLEGSTADGTGFIARLWEEANRRFGEIGHLAKTDADGRPTGIWGAMSDFSRTFHPWENDFTEGLYLAGVECTADAQPPEGWTKWVIPAYEYLCVENDGSGTFDRGLRILAENGLSLVGAVHDFTSPADGKGYMLFPVRKP